MTPWPKRSTSTSHARTGGRIFHLIFGTSTLGGGQLPGLSTDCMGGGWEEFLPQLKDVDFSGKTVALFGLVIKAIPGRVRRCDGEIYQFVIARGAMVVGQWSADGYEFISSKALVDDQFVGLVLDQENQKLLTDARLETWLKQIAPQFGLR